MSTPFKAGYGYFTNALWLNGTNHQASFQNPVGRLPRRVEAVIASKGGGVWQLQINAMPLESNVQQAFAHIPYLQQRCGLRLGFPWEWAVFTHIWMRQRNATLINMGSSMKYSISSICEYCPLSSEGCTIRSVVNLHDSFDIQSPIFPKKTIPVVQISSRPGGYLCSHVYVQEQQALWVTQIDKNGQRMHVRVTRWHRFCYL